MNPHPAERRAKAGSGVYNTRVGEPAAGAGEDQAAARSSVAENAEVARGFRNAPIAGALLATNIGVFLGQVFLAGDWHFALGMPDRVMRWLGANASLWTVADNRFETLVTSLFLHGSILHLGLNMVLLWQVGPLLERAIGSARFLSLYLAAGVVASAASAIWGRFFGQTMSVGASGALCGLIAAAMVVGVRTEGWRSELTIGMGRWLALIVAVGIIRAFRPGIAQIDNAAHIGGAFAGAVVAVLWERDFQYSPRAQQAIVAACTMAIVASGLVVFVRDRTDPYLFMDVGERVRAAYAAFQAGNCDRALVAIQRAAQMDPTSHSVRAAGGDLERECWDPGSSRRSGRRLP
ncbi:MAG: rhomboid family serine protease [Labilithrix sp.]|nr:rhomboid family serine protease [Labilithrix sp.]